MCIPPLKVYNRYPPYWNKCFIYKWIGINFSLEIHQCDKSHESTKCMFTVECVLQTPPSFIDRGISLETRSNDVPLHYWAGVLQIPSFISSVLISPQTNIRAHESFNFRNTFECTFASILMFTNYDECLELKSSFQWKTAIYKWIGISDAVYTQLG